MRIHVSKSRLHVMNTNRPAKKDLENMPENFYQHPAGKQAIIVGGGGVYPQHNNHTLKMKNVLHRAE